MKVSNSRKYWSNSLELLTPNRLDIMFKYLYLKFRNISPSFSKELYSQHIKHMTNGVYKEKDNSKTSLEEFYESFHNTFDSLRSKEFDPNISSVPISKDLSISNGAHRVASSIYLSQKVYCSIENVKKSKYGYSFFKERGMPEYLLDFAVLNYINLKPNTYLALIWPSADKNIEYLGNFQNIIYQKKFKLNYNGAHNFIAQVYKEQKWAGSFKNGYGGAHIKLAESFKDFSPVHAVFFHEESLERVNHIKFTLREKFKIEKGSIHITDNNYETLDLGKYILNTNSLHFLNYAKPYLFQNSFNRLKSFKTKLENLKINIDDIVIDGGTVLSVYGLRDSKDLDYISIDKNIREFDRHNDQVIFHDVEIEQLLYNPKFHFYFNDFKFISINQIKKMKKKRNEIKDKIDIKLIDKTSKDINIYILKILNYFNVIKTNFVAKLIPMSKKFGFYNTAKSIYKMLSK